MRNSTIPLSLFSACILNFVPLSAQAQLTVNTTQNSAISGNNNQVTQIVNQTIIYRPQNSNRSSNPNRSFDRENNEHDQRGDADHKKRGHHHKHHGRGSHREDRE
jgi:hypothetical protein